MFWQNWTFANRCSEFAGKSDDCSESERVSRSALHSGSGSLTFANIKYSKSNPGKSHFWLKSVLGAGVTGPVAAAVLSKVSAPLEMACVSTFASVLCHYGPIRPGRRGGSDAPTGRLQDKYVFSLGYTKSYRAQK